MVKTAKYEVEEGKIRLYKRPNSPYFWTQINNEDGTIRRVSTKEKTVEKATKQAIRLSIETEQAIENNLPTNTKTFSSVAKTIIKELESYRDTDFWKEVYASYIQVIKNYQIPYFKNKQLNVVRNDYANYLKYVEKQMGSKIAKSTVSTHASALKRILNTALVKGWITNASLPTANVSTKDGDRRASFELDEYNTMRTKLRAYKNADTHRKRDKSIRELLYDYVLFLANSGVRHGKEALRLTWKDVGKRTIGNNTYVYASVITFKGQGKKRKREVILRHNKFSDAIKNLQRCIDRNSKLKGKKFDAVIGKSDELIFVAVDENDKVFQPSRIDGTFKNFLEINELLVGSEGNRTLYSLRHFYATQELLRNNVSSLMLAKQMGTSEKMLEQHYGHLEVWQKAVELSGNIGLEE
jgi:integrase